MNKYRTKIGEVIGETFTDPEKYASRILPLAAIAETIATKGQGRNYAAEQQQGIYAQAARNRANEQQKYERGIQEEDRRNAAVNRALEKKKIDMELSAAEKKAKTDASERARLEQYQYEVDNGADPVETHKKYWPKEFAQAKIIASMKPEKEKVNITVTMKDLNVKDIDAATQKLSELNAQNPDYKFSLRPDAVNPFDVKQFESNLRKDEAAAASSAAQEQTVVSAHSIKDMINDISNNPNAATGLDVRRLTEAVQGTPQYDFAQQVGQLRDLLGLMARGQIKGTGQISDLEQKMLLRSQTLLSTGLSRKAFKAELERLDKFIGDKISAAGQAKETIESVKKPTEHRFNSVQEAESANLPKGTTIYIQGRKAVVE